MEMALSVLENVGLDRDDRQQPDKMTIFQYTLGNFFIMDATCVDRHSSSALTLSAL